MASEDDKNLEAYKAALRAREQDWRAQFEIVLFSDRAAVDIGLTALRIALLINAGAIVALLAFAGQLWNENGQQMAGVLDASTPFVWGVFSAALAAGVAYFYQSFVTAKAQYNLKKISRGAEELKPQIWIPRLTDWTRIAMITLVVLSYILFLWGAFDVTNTVASGNPPTPTTTAHPKSS